MRKAILTPLPHRHGSPTPSEPRASASGTQNRGYASFRKLVLTILLASSAFAQSKQFEVASIKPFDPSAQGQALAGVHVDGAQIRLAGLSLRDLLAMAYRIKATLITGPDWTATERFDISATLPDGAARAQLPEMMQALLADRFKVKVHNDKKEFPVYALLVGKGGSKLKESPPGPAADKDEPAAAGGGVVTTKAGNGVSVNYGHGSSYTFASNRFDAHKLTMPIFAGNLERFADRQIVDMTGLSATYDFAFDVAPEDYIAMLLRSAVWAGVNLPPQAQKMLDDSSPAALGDALQQIGLKLEARKAPLDVLVIDEALKTPTAN
jgi:uncharacterized protein (TIGR03435 family)